MRKGVCLNEIRGKTFHSILLITLTLVSCCCGEDVPSDPVQVSKITSSDAEISTYTKAPETVTSSVEEEEDGGTQITKTDHHHKEKEAASPGAAVTQDDLEPSFVTFNMETLGTITETVTESLETLPVPQSVVLDQSEESPGTKFSDTSVQSDVAEEESDTLLSLSSTVVSETDQAVTPSAADIVDEALEIPDTVSETAPEKADETEGQINILGVLGVIDTQPEQEEEKTEATTTTEGRGDQEVEKDEGKKDEELTFNEWAQKVLAEEEKGKQDAESDMVVVPSTKQQKRRKNYAQRDCGAKVLASNPEANNAAGILNHNKDDYMINPCSVKKWFVVELCEPIQAQSVEIASLELFSSQPKSFRLYLSDRYPSKDWKSAGSYPMVEERTVQTFTITEGSEYFTKYVKVELLEHYGEEHFCPLTLLRINGMGVDYDEREDDDDNDDVDTDVPSSEETDTDSNLFTRTKDTVLKIVKKVLNVEEPVAVDDPSTNLTDVSVNETLGRSGNASQNTSSPHNQSLPCVPEVKSPGEAGPTVAPDSGPTQPQVPTITTEPSSNGADESIVTKLEDDEQMPSEVTPDEPLVVHIGHEDISDSETEPYDRCLSCGTNSGKNLGCSVPSLSCQYKCLWLRQSLEIFCVDFKASQPPQVDQSVLSTQSSRTSQLVLTGTPVVTPTEISDDLKEISETQSTIIEASVEQSLVSDEHSGNTVTESSVVQNEVSNFVTTEVTRSTESEIDDKTVTTTFEPTQTKTGQLSDVIQSTHSDKALEHTQILTSETKVKPEDNKQTSIDLDLDLTPSMVSTLQSDMESGKSGEATPPLSSVPSWKPDTSNLMNSQQDTLGIEITSTDYTALPTISGVDSIPEALDSGIKQPDIDATETASVALEAGQTTTSDVPSVDISDQDLSSDNKTTGTGKNGKDLGLVRVPVNIPLNKRESAIMRLSNRIKTLEQNVSLSSRFLEELSRRYKKQSEDMMKTLNKTVAKLNDVTAASDAKDKRYEEQISIMEERLKNMTAMVNKLTTNLSSLNKEVTDRQMIWTTIEIIVLFLVLIFFHRRAKPPAITQEMKELIESMPTSPVPPVQYRRNSISGPATPSKRKNDINPGPSLQKHNSDTALADFPVIQPATFISVVPSQQREGTKKKKKKKHKNLESKSSAGLTGESTLVDQIGTKHNGAAGLLFESVSDISSGTSTYLASSSPSYSAKSSSSSSSMSVPSPLNGTACKIMTSSSVGRKPPKPPSPSVVNKRSTNNVEGSKGHVKGHKRVASLPKHGSAQVSDKIGLDSAGTSKTTASVSKTTHGNHGNQHSKSGRSSSFEGYTIPSCQTVGSSVSDENSHAIHQGRGKRQIPQCGVQALYYGIDDVPYQGYTNSNGASLHISDRQKWSSDHTPPTENGYHSDSGGEKNLSPGDYAHDTQVLHHCSLAGESLYSECSANVSESPSDVHNGRHSIGGWKKFTSLFK